jgi:hypothetical protein
MKTKKLTAFAGSVALTGALMVSGAAPAQAVLLNCGHALNFTKTTISVWCASGPLNGYFISVNSCGTSKCIWTQTAPVRYGRPITAQISGFYNSYKVTPVRLP